MNELLEAPTQDEILQDNDVLMPMQWVTVEGRGMRRTAAVAWDKGATTALIRKAVAEELHLPGTPVSLRLQTAGHGFEPWETTAYSMYLIDKLGTKRRIVVYSMDSITSDMEEVETSPMVHIFQGLGIMPQDLVRPHGPVDILIGVNYASLHPFDDAVPRLDGEM